MEEARSGLMSNGAQAGPGDLPTLAKGDTPVPPPTRAAPLTSGLQQTHEMEGVHSTRRKRRKHHGWGDSNTSYTVCNDRLRLFPQFSQFYFFLL